MFARQKFSFSIAMGSDGSNLLSVGVNEDNDIDSSHFPFTSLSIKPSDQILNVLSVIPSHLLAKKSTWKIGYSIVFPSMEHTK